MSNLSKKYKEVIAPELMKEFGIKNTMAVPKIKKIIINMGIGDAIKNKELKEKLITDLGLISGQRPSQRQAKVSIASFAIRKGMVVGIASTLRGERMYDFLEKFVNITLPRLRDFRGVSDKSFDEGGNYSIGIAEHTVFPEASGIDAAPAHGIEINISTSAKNKKEGKRLLELVGMPFVKKD